MIFGAYCVDKLHNMLPGFFYDKGSIFCRKGTQYACYLGSVMKMEKYYENLSILCRLRYTICYLGSMII